MSDNERDQIIEQVAEVLHDHRLAHDNTGGFRGVLGGWNRNCTCGWHGVDQEVDDYAFEHHIADKLADLLQPSSAASEDWKRVAQDALAGQALMGAEFEKLRAERDHALAESKRAWKMPNTYVYLVWSANNLEEKVLKAVFSKKILARDYVITWYGSEGRLEQDPDSDSFWVYDGFKDIWITRMEVLS